MQQSTTTRRGGASRRSPRVQKIVQNSLNLNGLSSEMAEYVVATLTINGQNVHVATCYIMCGVPWDPRVLVTVRSRGREEALICGDFNAHPETSRDNATTTRGRMLQDTLRGLDFRNITSKQPTYVRAGVWRTVIDLTFTAGAPRLTATPQPGSWGSEHIPITVRKPVMAPPKRCIVVKWDVYRALIDSALCSG